MSVWNRVEKDVVILGNDEESIDNTYEHEMEENEEDIEFEFVFVQGIEPLTSESISEIQIEDSLMESEKKLLHEAMLDAILKDSIRGVSSSIPQ